MPCWQFRPQSDSSTQQLVCNTHDDLMIDRHTCLARSLKLPYALMASSAFVAGGMQSAYGLLRSNYTLEPTLLVFLVTQNAREYYERLKQLCLNGPHDYQLVRQAFALEKDINILLARKQLLLKHLPADRARSEDK